MKRDDSYISIQCPTCQQLFVMLSSQTLEHQTERAHSGRMRTVHVISEEDRT